MNPILDAAAFRGRVRGEAARASRSGGFLTVLLIQVRAVRAAGGGLAAIDDTIARLRGSVRLQDVPGRRDARTFGLLMPDTTLAEGTRAARRLMGLLGDPKAPGIPLDVAAGLACSYGEVEGGADALIAAAEEAVAEAQPGTIASSRSLEGRPRVLVVDDDQTFAQALADAITERGWEGHPCSAVEDARQRVAGAGYSGLFVDLVLSGTTGVAVLRHALAAVPRRPAALMSGVHAGHTLIAEALELGPVVFVRKPISPSDLDDTLRMFRELLPGAGRKRA
jgi:CheY-like chemotaxis protein